MEIITAVGQALQQAGDMFWDVFWPLVLGFGLSAIVQALVSHRTMARLLGDDSPRSLTLATLFGASAVQAETTVIRRDAPDTVVVDRPSTESRTVERRESSDGCSSKTVTKENDLGDRKTVTKESCD